MHHFSAETHTHDKDAHTPRARHTESQHLFFVISPSHPSSFLSGRKNTRIHTMSGIWTSICVPVGTFLDDFAKLGWNHGPLGCMGDCDDLGSVPCRTLVCFGPVQAGLTNKALGNNCCVGFCCAAFPFCVPVIAAIQRAQIRKRNNIEGCVIKGKAAMLEDCVCGVFCAPCVLQQVREGGRERGRAGETGMETERQRARDVKPDTPRRARRSARGWRGRQGPQS